MPTGKKETPWIKDWKNIAAAVAVVASGFASVRGEMASEDASVATVKAKQATRNVVEEVDMTATAVLAILNQRIGRLEETEQDVRIYIAAMDQRDKYWEKMLWDVYRGRHGASAADRMLDLAPAKPEPPPLVTRTKEPVPKSAAAAKQQYQKACASGDALCADLE